MSQKPTPPPDDKQLLHPRNKHRSRYDFDQLVASSPALAAFMQVNSYGDASIDFANPAALKALNQALLRHFYRVAAWDIPAGYLCPPIPGRADYIHYLADLLASSNQGVVPRGKGLKVLDIGVGANCIYPILGHQEYGWRFVGSDTDPKALNAARRLVAANHNLVGAIDLRLQPEPQHILAGIVKPGEVFDATVCNPPFHGSLAEATAGTQRKLTNLGAKRGARPVLNFGGQNTELWCPGGEKGFVRRLVSESQQLPTSCFWFTTLISKKDTLPAVYHALRQAAATDVRTINMAQGQKKSRLVAWTFLTLAQQEAWRQARWPSAI